MKEHSNQSNILWWNKEKAHDSQIVRAKKTSSLAIRIQPTHTYDITVSPIMCRLLDCIGNVYFDLRVILKAELGIIDSQYVTFDQDQFPYCPLVSFKLEKWVIEFVF